MIGAAFSDDLVFMQQSVLQAAGPNVLSSRRIESWSLKSNSLVKERTLAAGRSGLIGDECGRIEAEVSAGRILVCADDETLAFLDAGTLGTLSEIHCGGRIFDFAIDHKTERAFVVWQSTSDDQYLTVFDIASGKQFEQAKISSGTLAGAQIAIDPRTKEVVIAQSRYGHSGYTTSLFGCSYIDGLTCEPVATAKQVAQIAILGQEALLASGLLADDPHVCLTSVNLATKAMANEYCAPGTGVHYGVGVAARKYVVGYSGVEKRMHWKETTLNVSSSVSVWRFETGKVAAEAVQERVPGTFQSGVRIACNRDAPQFLLYNVTSNVAYVYSIGEPSTK